MEGSEAWEMLVPGYLAVARSIDRSHHINTHKPSDQQAHRFLIDLYLIIPIPYGFLFEWVV
jgi:hypothetical protein